MKIRWTQNSVRFRITPSELASLQNGAPVREALALPGAGNNGCWRAEIAPRAAATAIALDFGRALRIALSADDLVRLAAPAAEGVYFSTPASAAQPEFKYFIEKDFPCAHPRAAESHEPSSEVFEAPEEFNQRKK